MYQYKTAVITINSICTLTAAISPTLGSNGTVSYTAVHNGTAVSYNWSNGSTVRATKHELHRKRCLYGHCHRQLLFTGVKTATAVSSVTVNNVCNLSASFTVVRAVTDWWISTTSAPQQPVQQHTHGILATAKPVHSLHRPSPILRTVCILLLLRPTITQRRPASAQKYPSCQCRFGVHAHCRG